MRHTAFTRAGLATLFLMGCAEPLEISELSSGPTVDDPRPKVVADGSSDAEEEQAEESGDHRGDEIDGDSGETTGDGDETGEDAGETGHGSDETADDTGEDEGDTDEDETGDDGDEDGGDGETGDTGDTGEPEPQLGTAGEQCELDAECESGLTCVQTGETPAHRGVCAPACIDARADCPVVFANPVCILDDLDGDGVTRFCANDCTRSANVCDNDLECFAPWPGFGGRVCVGAE